MKILHFADLHLGVESYGRLDPQTGLSTRFGDFLSALDEVVDFALDNGVDLVLFCGDAYKSRNPSQTQQREFARRIKRLTAGGVPIFLLVGNHDLPNAIGRATTVEIFNALEVEKVLVANHRSTWKVETKGGALQVVALPWTQRSALLSRDEYKNLSLEQLNHRMQESLRQWLAAQASSLEPTLPTLLAAHVSIATANPGSEKSMMIGREHILTQSDIALPPFDYVALGHIHKRQSLGQNPPVVYPGSLSAIDFSDEGEEKGFYVIELERTRASGERVLSYSFHPVKTRRFLTIEVEDDTENPTAAVLHALAKRDTKDAIVRLQIKLSASQQGLLRESEVQRALKDAHFVTITKEVQHQPRIRLGNCPAEGLTPMAALKSYLESKRTTPQRTEVLLEYGERLIQEQD